MVVERNHQNELISHHETLIRLATQEKPLSTKEVTFKPIRLTHEINEHGPSAKEAFTQMTKKETDCNCQMKPGRSPQPEAQLVLKINVWLCARVIQEITDRHCGRCLASIFQHSPIFPSE